MKKKLLFTLIAAAVILLPAQVLANVGDIAGSYYSTDISTILNGVEIYSINIGGETLISAEDMSYYSFRVYWDDEARTLEISSVKNASNGAPPAVVKPDCAVGTELGAFYETNIVTYLDGNVITAYNIGGRTYIHAEQMRDFGYIVDWDERARTLNITSPDRAGYVYTVNLARGTKKSTEGVGAFTISYANDKSIGTGDADYFDLRFEQDNLNTYFVMGFYQNAGLFYATSLQDTLRPLAYCGYGVSEELDPAALYDLVNQTISISINGQKSECVDVISSAGSGHRDFVFVIKDLPRLKQTELESIEISVGGAVGEPYEIDTQGDSTNFEAKTLEALRQYPNDFVYSSKMSENYLLINLCESPSLGVIYDRLYLVNRNTGEISEDISQTIRRYDGLNADRLSPYYYDSDYEKDEFYFSCGTDERTAYFHLDAATMTVTEVEWGVWWQL